MLTCQRITIPEILEDVWFKKDYKPAVFEEKKEANLADVEAVFKDSEVSHFIYSEICLMIELKDLVAGNNHLD